MFLHATHQLEKDDKIPQEHHAIVPSSSSNMGKEITTLLQARPMDPSKDLAAYGYGSVAWKERMDIWKQRQSQLGNMRKENENDEDLDKLLDDEIIEFPL